MFSATLPTHCPKEEGTATLFPSEGGCQSIGYDFRQLPVRYVLRISLALPCSSHLRIRSSQDGIVFGHYWCARVRGRFRGCTAIARFVSFLPIFSCTCCFVSMGRHAIHLLNRFACFFSPHPTAIVIPNRCVHSTARASRMVRPRLDQLHGTFRSRRRRIQGSRAAMRCKAIALASAST